MNRPAILKKTLSWHGHDREAIVTKERGDEYFVKLVDGCGYWVHKSRIEFTDQGKLDL